MGTEAIEVLLVDDHAIARNGVRVMLESADGIVITGEAENAEQALRLAQERRFDVALVDIVLPDKNGLEFLKLLRASGSRLPVLMLSAYSEEVYAVRAIKAGAAGYLTKNSACETMAAAVRSVAAGGRHIGPALAERLADIMVGDKPSLLETLSDRELAVLKLIASGESIPRIAERLYLSPHTVATYRTRIWEKTGIRGNAKLAIFALENGLLN
jgi:DNA-binding NarL/FixJ family response regulator